MNRFQNPRIILLDCNLEYKKGESQTNVEISGETVSITSHNRTYIDIIANSIFTEFHSTVRIRRGTRTSPMRGDHCSETGPGVHGERSVGLGPAFPVKGRNQRD